MIIFIHMAVSKNRGILPPKWLVYFMENPMKHGMIWGVILPPLFLGSTPRPIDRFRTANRSHILYDFVDHILLACSVKVHYILLHVIFSIPPMNVKLFFACDAVYHFKPFLFMTHMH